MCKKCPIKHQTSDISLKAGKVKDRTPKPATTAGLEAGTLAEPEGGVDAHYINAVTDIRENGDALNVEN